MDTPMKRAVWIQTFTGRKFFPWAPDNIDIRDIARALAQTPRWRGQYKRSVEFYSVAQHSIYVSRLVPREAKLWALMHDAAEWPLGDLPRPIKECLPEFSVIEHGILEKIITTFDIPINDEIHRLVKMADRWMLFEEARQLLVNPTLTAEWNVKPPEFPGARRVRVTPWPPREAEERFLKEFEALTNGQKRNRTVHRSTNSGRTQDRGKRKQGSGSARDRAGDAQKVSA